MTLSLHIDMTTPFAWLHKNWAGVQKSLWVTYQVWSHRWRNHGRYATVKMAPWKFGSGFFTTIMDVYCLFSPINHIIITQLDKICLSCGVEILTDKWGDADNIFILRSMQKWLEYRVSHFTESLWEPCHIMAITTFHSNNKFQLVPWKTLERESTVLPS